MAYDDDDDVPPLDIGDILSDDDIPDVPVQVRIYNPDGDPTEIVINSYVPVQVRRFRTGYLCLTLPDVDGGLPFSMVLQPDIARKLAADLMNPTPDETYG